MTEQNDVQPDSTLPDMATGDESFDAYTAAMSGSETPLLGHVVVFSIYDGPVTRENLESWFRELELDLDYVPPPLRAVDAFEKVTGPDGVRASYSLDNTAVPEAATNTDATDAKAAHTRAPRRRGGDARVATLMVRHVSRGPDQIVRNVVREVRDEAATTLSYDTQLGQCVFRRSTGDADGAGAGTMHVAPDKAAISALPSGEQKRVTSLLFDLHEEFQRRCTYLSGDKLRGLIRTYIEGLGGIKIKPTGGVYFVHRRHTKTLAALRELVSQFGGGSILSRIPIPEQDEMREMIISTFTTKATDDLNRLARDIADAQRAGASEATVQRLYGRFRELTSTTAEHAELLNTSLDDAEAALQLVKVQLGSLLSQTG